MSLYHYCDAGRGESVDLFYEDDMVALNTTKPTENGQGSFHEVMLPLGTVDDLIKHLTIMRDTIAARMFNAEELIIEKEPTS